MIIKVKREVQFDGSVEPGDVRINTDFLMSYQARSRWVMDDGAERHREIPGSSLRLMGAKEWIETATTVEEIDDMLGVEKSPPDKRRLLSDSEERELLVEVELGKIMPDAGSIAFSEALKRAIGSPLMRPEQAALYGKLSLARESRAGWA